MTADYLLWFIGIIFAFILLYGTGGHLIIKNIIKEILNNF